MTADDYLNQILVREAVDSGPCAPILGVQAVLQPALTAWAGRYLNTIKASGSFAKGTANKSGTDIDLFISLSHTTPETLKQIYDSLCQKMTAVGLTPRQQNVSVGVTVRSYNVDLVPGKRQNGYTDDHSLYRRKANTWIKTNVDKHITHVRQGGRTSETRIVKLWRNQKRLEFPSFYLELSIMAALSGRYIGTLSRNVLSVFQYLRDAFPTARMVDPANTNNIISDDLTVAERARVRAAAAHALAVSNWNQIVQ